MKFATQLYAGAAATAMCLAALPAMAQTATAQTGAEVATVEEIVVTGSRIRRSGTTTPTPTTIVDTAVIEQSGVTEIADLVNQIPSLFVTQSNQTSNQQGNAGLNALDLRGLGTHRTLVLVNGRRRVPAVPGSSAVDVSAIPTQLVERVEVITGGASALYGADAVAGVANFILKKDFDGLAFNGTYSGSTRGDLTGYDASLLLGRNFGDGRGNITGFLNYSDHTDPALGQDRPWTAAGTPSYVRQSNGTYKLTDGNRSLYDLDTAVIELGNRNIYTVNPDGTLRRPIYGPSGLQGGGAGASLADYRTDGGEFQGRYDDWALIVPTERVSGAITMNYQLTPTTKLFADLNYSHTDSSAITRARTSYGYDTLYAGSPFITPEMIAAGGTGNIAFSRRFTELGRQYTDYDRSMYQLTLGLEGDFTAFGNRHWNWAAHYSYGETEQTVTVRNATASGRYYNALDAYRDTDGSIKCVSTWYNPGDGCVPLNPFKPLTQDVIDYLQYSTSGADHAMDQHVVSAYLTGDLFTLPAGTVKAVLGAEYRKESNDIGVAPEYNPDHALYDPTLQVTAEPLVGGYEVKEAFAELSVPLLANLPGAQELSFESAVRYSEYSTAGDTTAYKFALNWRPIEDVRFRASYGQAVRAPNITELYTSAVVASDWLKDPCNYYDIDNRSSRTEFTKPNCLALNPQNTSEYWQWLPVNWSGNEELKVETATTYTLGMVIQPRFIPNLSLTVDYFDIDLEDAIGTFGAQTIMEKCLDAESLDNMFCALVNRDPVTKNLISVDVQQLNLSRFATRGIDYEARYWFPLSAIGMGEEAGTISINAVYTNLLERSFVLDPTDPSTHSDTVGLFGSPEWKGAIRTTWNAGPWTVNWNLRHFAPMRPGSHVTKDLYDVYKTDHVFYTDLYAAYQVNEKVSVYGGLRNAFDREPPRLPGAEAGGANFEYGYQAGTYDVLGRTFYLGVTFRQ